MKSSAFCTINSSLRTSPELLLLACWKKQETTPTTSTTRTPLHKEHSELLHLEGKVQNINEIIFQKNLLKKMQFENPCCIGASWSRLTLICYIFLPISRALCRATTLWATIYLQLLGTSFHWLLLLYYIARQHKELYSRITQARM